MIKPAEYPSLYHEHKTQMPQAPWIEVSSPESRCINCGGKGFLVAFFPDHDKTHPVGKVPYTPKDKILKWSGKAWLVGENRVYNCPVCQ